jgi:hypothetical protein
MEFRILGETHATLDIDMENSNAIFLVKQTFDLALQSRLKFADCEKKQIGGGQDGSPDCSGSRGGTDPMPRGRGDHKGGATC